MSVIHLSHAAKIDACALLRQSRLFGHLPSEEYHHLLKGAASLSLEKNQTLFHRDDVARFWYIVLNGRVDTLRFNQEGSELVFHHLQRGQFVAVFVMFSDCLHYPVEARAACPSLLCRVSRDNLHALSAREPGVALKLLQHASDRMCASLDSIETLTCRSVEQRLARYLLRLYLREGEVIAMPFNQRMLASQLGVRAETLSRTLSQWKRCGYLVCERSHWQLKDIDLLQRLGN